MNSPLPDISPNDNLLNGSFVPIPNTTVSPDTSNENPFTTLSETLNTGFNLIPLLCKLVVVIFLFVAKFPEFLPISLQLVDIYIYISNNKLIILLY